MSPVAHHRRADPSCRGPHILCAHTPVFSAFEQTHHRMREATHRYTAEYMNERVQIVSAAEALFLVVLSFFQVLYLRGLFAEKRDKW